MNSAMDEPELEVETEEEVDKVGKTSACKTFLWFCEAVPNLHDRMLELMDVLEAKHAEKAHVCEHQSLR